MTLVVNLLATTVRRIDVLCEEILQSLEQDDERTLDRAEADLQDTLYELNREIRLQYDDEEDDDFLGAIKKTFLGDDDDKYVEDYSYDPRQTDYYNDGGSYGYPPSRDAQRPAAGYDNRNDAYNNPYSNQSRRPGGYDDRNDAYNNPYSNQSRRSGGYDDRPSRGYDNSARRPGYDDPYTSRQEPSRTTRRDSRGNYPPQDPYNGRNSARNDSYSNDWDDEDDEWF